MQRQRAKERNETFVAAKHRYDESIRKSGAILKGRDENGQAVETKSLSSLGIVVDKWYVNMSFKREDRRRLGGMSLREIEEKLKKGHIKRKPARMSTHIIMAVRTLKHIREGYEEEMEHTDKILKELDALNISLAGIKGKVPDKAIDAAVSWLKSFGESELAKKQVAVKSIVAKARLDKTIGMLEQLKDLPPQKRAVQLSRACAVFTSLRNRLGKWRDKDVIRMMEHNHRKECALRIARDEWLFSRLSKFAESPEQIHEYIIIDKKKAEFLQSIRGMLENKKISRQKIMGEIWGGSHLFRVAERERKGAEQKIALMEVGRQSWDKRKTDFLIGHYAWLYRYIKRGKHQMELAKSYEKMAKIEEHNAKSQDDKSKAKKHKEKRKEYKEKARRHRALARLEERKAFGKIEYLMLFIDSNKPRFMLEELYKDPEYYLRPVLDPFEGALGAFKTQDFKTAKTYFAQAKDQMQKIVGPER